MMKCVRNAGTNHIREMKHEHTRYNPIMRGRCLRSCVGMGSGQEVEVMAYKVYSDSYLKTFTKDALIRQLRCVEKNWQAAEEQIEQQYQNTKDWEPVRHGKWIWNLTGYYTWTCSECGKNPTIGMGYTQSENKLFAYCPNCGAKMDKTSDK